MKISLQFSISVGFTGGKKRKKQRPLNSTDSEIPEILEFQGSATEIRPQPTYAGFAIPEEEV